MYGPALTIVEEEDGNWSARLNGGVEVAGAGDTSTAAVGNLVEQLRSMVDELNATLNAIHDLTGCIPAKDD